MGTDPKRAKIQSSHQSFFALLGTVPIKASHKMLTKMTQGVNFIIVLQTAFTCVEPKSVKEAVKSSIFLLFWELHE